MTRYPAPPASQGPVDYTDTTSSVTTGTSSQQQSSSSSGTRDWNQQTTGTSRTQDVTDRTVTTKNMDDEAYGMLMNFLRQQAAGGSAEDRRRREAIWGEIAASQTRRAGYSKGAAVLDSTAAASAQMTNALKEMLPAITAGVDAAGTSGSAMAALLSQNAAEAVSRNAAQLQLDAVVSYGQIANQSSGIIAELLKIDDQSANRFLEGLNIAKGARITTHDRTVRNINTQTSENVRGSERTSNQSSSTTTGSTSSSTTGTSSRAYDQGNQGGGGGGSPQYGQSLITPSSYRYGN